MGQHSSARARSARGGTRAQHECGRGRSLTTAARAPSPYSTPGSASLPPVKTRRRASRPWKTPKGSLDLAGCPRPGSTNTALEAPEGWSPGSNVTVLRTIASFTCVLLAPRAIDACTAQVTTLVTWPCMRGAHRAAQGQEGRTQGARRRARAEAGGAHARKQEVCAAHRNAHGDLLGGRGSLGAREGACLDTHTPQGSLHFIHHFGPSLDVDAGVERLRILRGIALSVWLHGHR